MMEKIQFIQVTPEQLKSEISLEVKTYLDEFLENFKPPKQNDYLSRKKVAEMFSVDLSTLHNWNKSGRLSPLGIGGRVYYLRSDIENSLKYLYTREDEER